MRIDDVFTRLGDRQSLAICRRGSIEQPALTAMMAPLPASLSEEQLREFGSASRESPSAMRNFNEFQMDWLAKFLRMSSAIKAFPLLKKSSRRMSTVQCKILARVDSACLAGAGPARGATGSGHRSDSAKTTSPSMASPCATSRRTGASRSAPKAMAFRAGCACASAMAKTSAAIPLPACHGRGSIH